MMFIETNGIRYKTLATFSQYGVVHGFVSRHGGVSSGQWQSLNLGGTNGDNPEDVLKNHQLLFTAFGRSFSSMFDVWQVHGREVVCTQEPRPRGVAHQQADGILTDAPAITLLMRFADCVPILLYDPISNAGGIVHAGWQGTVKKIAAAAIDKMKDIYGSDPHHILAGIGPSIGPGDYQVGHEVVEQAEMSFPKFKDQVLLEKSSNVHFDLWTANRLTLEECGVKSVEIVGISTFTNTQDWFSHRREQGKTGRFGVLFALPG